MAVCNTQNSFLPTLTDKNSFDKLLQEAVCNRNFKLWEHALNNALELITGEQTALIQSFFKSLSEIYENNEDSGRYFEITFSQFCKTFGNNSNLIYRIFVVLCDIIGFDLGGSILSLDIEIGQSPTYSFNKSLEIITKLLQVLAKQNVDINSIIGGTTITCCLQDLLKSILGLCGAPNQYCYQLLVASSVVNPLIIEALIEEILEFTLLSSDQDLGADYAVLISRILEIFNKLRRIQHFLTKFIANIKDLSTEKRPPAIIYKFKQKFKTKRVLNELCEAKTLLPEQFLNDFVNCLVALPSWQIINLFKMFIYQLGEALALNKPNFVLVEVVGTLIRWFLSGIRIAEHTVNVDVVKKFLNGLEDLKSLLKLLGTNLLLLEYNDILTRTFLSLALDWAEIYMVVTYYCTEDDIKIETTTDNDLSPSNLIYLHSYLSREQWGLISERIENFGQNETKNIMRKLVVQKLKAMTLFEETINDSILDAVIQDWDVNFDDDLISLFHDPFIINNLINRMPHSLILKLSQIYVRQLIRTDSITLISQLIDYSLIVNGFLNVIMLKINKLLKQKRKSGEESVKKSRLTRILGLLPDNVFFCENLSGELKKAMEIVFSKDEAVEIDIKLNEEKIGKYFDILKELPIIFCNSSTIEILIVLLLGLYKDIRDSNSSDGLQQACGALITGILEKCKYRLSTLCQLESLIEFIINNFTNFETLHSIVLENYFKNSEPPSELEPLINALSNNLKDERYLKCSTITLNLLRKVVKSKVSPETKAACTQYKTKICSKLAKRISKQDVTDYLIEPYAITLKNSALNNDNHYASLTGCLNNYLEFCFNNLSPANIKGTIILFLFILNNKSTLTDIPHDFIEKVWSNLKSFPIPKEINAEYSQLISLLATLSSNEQFSLIIKDLGQLTIKSLDLTDMKSIKYLKTWTSILSCNLNETKIRFIHDELEQLQQKLIYVIKLLESDIVLEEIAQFETAMIKTFLFPLTAPLIDLLIMNITLLITKSDSNFVNNFNFAITVMMDLLKYRKPLIMDRLPPYLQQYRLLLNELCLNSNTALNLNENQIKDLAHCSHLLEKLTKELVLCQKDLVRIVPYLIADVLDQYEMVTLYAQVKFHLNNCIYSLISLCDQHGIAFLMRVLSNASTEIFKIMYDTYKKHHRFVGKI